MKLVHYYWYYKRSNGRRNFGDDFNRDLFRFLGDRLGVYFFDVSQKSKLFFLKNNLRLFVKRPALLFPTFKKRYESKTWVGIGSVLSSSGQKHGIIFGSGLIKPSIGLLSLPHQFEDIILLRGHKTKIELGLDQTKSIAFGDPGLLASRIFPNESECIIYETLVILHYSHICKRKEISSFFQGMKYKIITAENTPEYVAGMIMKSKYVVSSSLHGIIFAHSYGKKAVRLKFEDYPLKGGDFKWLDYLSIYNLPSHNFFGSYTLDQMGKSIKSDWLDSHWTPSLEEVGEIQNYLLKRFDDYMLND